MIRVHVICEGQTEEEFVRHLLVEPFLKKGVALCPSRIGKVGHKGGNFGLERLGFDVRARLLKDAACYCTTLFDYYGLPADFPGKAEGASRTDIADKQGLVVKALSEWALAKLGEHAAARFAPYVQMYEFEGLLFSEPDRLADSFGVPGSVADFRKIRSDFKTPEWINDDPQTAPSKRIEKLFPSYDKPKHPLLASQDIGLEALRRECLLFNAWLTRLEELT